VTTKNNLVNSGHSLPYAATHGFQDAFWGLIALALIGAVAAFVLLRGTHAPEPSADAEPARA